MDREFYLDLARSGLKMPVGADLVLHEKPNPNEILADGVSLGQVLVETARRFKTPLAFPHMDLTLEKAAILGLLGVPELEASKAHWSSPFSDQRMDEIGGLVDRPLTPMLQAHVDSISYVARNTDLVPIGMAIGPFSLMTKMLADPITPICMAGAGCTAEEDDEIKLVEQALDISTRFVMRSIRAQIEAGARAIFIAEPAANKVYLSPNQIGAGSDIFDRYVMAPNRRVRSLLDEANVDLVFHCCGELIDLMVAKFGDLDPAILSLGSSRVLWEDAALLPERTVLYGNLPSKAFYSDDLITSAQVEERSRELLYRMRQVDHPFILGTECDVLSVPGCYEAIYGKALALTNVDEPAVIAPTRECSPMWSGFSPGVGVPEATLTDLV